MSDFRTVSVAASLDEKLRQASPPDWVRKMIEHYHRHGTFRPEDLRRVLGDPTKGVEVGPDVSLSAMRSSTVK